MFSAAHLMGLFSLLLLVGCAKENVVTPPVTDTGICEYLSPTELRIEGFINAGLLDCVTGGTPDQVEILRVDTPGGDIRAAIEIARSFSNRLHIIVEGECNSSCANYFIPLADRLTLMPDSIIVLHGSADQGLVDTKRGRMPEDEFAAFVETSARQSAFIADYSIHPGWLKIRDKSDYENSTLGKYLEGEIDIDKKSPEPIIMKNIMVYEPLLRSCFQNMKIDGLESAGFQTFKKDTPFRASLMAQGFVGSGTLRCT